MAAPCQHDDHGEQPDDAGRRASFARCVSRAGVPEFRLGQESWRRLSGGSQAQEESLARASGLYATLQTQPAFYAHHRQLRTSMYSDHAIVSPGVPVFRDDADQLLEHPWRTAFITAAAVNAGAIARNEPQRRSQIVPAMEQRARVVLGIAAAQRCDALVLGAWGCGVFRNDPDAIAAIWARVLTEPPFARRFRHIAFAVYDTTREQRTLAVFRDVFG